MAAMQLTNSKLSAPTKLTVALKMTAASRTVRATILTAPAPTILLVLLATIISRMCLLVFAPLEHALYPIAAT